MRTTVGILSLLAIAAFAGCSSDDAVVNPDPAPMTVRVNVDTSPVGCGTNVYWVSSPDGMSGQMLNMTSSGASTPELVPTGTMISVQADIDCAVPGSHGGIDAAVQVMVNGTWQDAPVSGTNTCNIADGPGGCVVQFTSQLS